MQTNRPSAFSQMSKYKLPLLAAFALAAGTSQAQLQWNSYDNNGNLLSANVASGGDATYGGSATLTVPANTQRIFMTETFLPLSLAAASSSAKINFYMSASGALYPGNASRLFGFGLLSDAGTASAVQDPGLWTDFNTGNPSFELFYRLSSVATFFQYDSAHKFGASTVKDGYPSNNVTYLMQFQVNMNSAGTGIGIGTGTTWATAGAGMTNSGVAGVWEAADSGGNTEPTATLGTSSFNAFAFSFNNQSASPVTVTLSGITLVPANPAIATQPLGYSGGPGDNTPGADFAVTLNPNSATPLAYQWYQVIGTVTNVVSNGVTATGSTISGATTANLSFANAQTGDSAGYFVVVTNTYGSATSSPALLNIAALPAAPVISSVVPASATIIAGNGTNIVVSATGSPSPVYLWYDNNGNLLQAGPSQTLPLANVQLPAAGTYSVIASNSVGTATSNFTLVVIVTPTISSQPTNLLLNVGDPANFSVTASGVPAPTYQWYKGNSPISGATGTNYSIASVALTNIGVYTVVVTNAAGGVTSAKAVLAVYSTTMTATPAVPANNATKVCYDTPLTLAFNQPPAVGTTGKIYIYDANNTATPVDTLDLSAGNPQARTIGGDIFNTYPVIASGNAAVIYPHLGILTSNQTYYVTWDTGVFVDTNGAYLTGDSNPGDWQFSTKAGGPENPTNLVVAADGSGDFATVQGAVDSVASGNTNFTLIKVHDGFYQEIVDVHSKNNLVFRGQSRAGTIIGYANNNGINGSTHSRMAFKVNANDIAFDNLTITNLTPQDVSQAEALMIESGAARIIVNNCNVDSYQDTILANISTSKAYFYNSLIQGDVDFIWGGGNLFFTNCEIRYLTRISNSAALGPNPSPTATDISSNGFSFVNCALTTSPGANPNDTVGRTRSITNGNTALINCFVSTNIGGWYSDALPTANFRNWYYGCTNDLGASVTLSNGIALAASDPNVALADSAGAWLYGWQPALLPNIVSEPASQATSAGQPVNFAVGATGIPDPAYQWYQNGTILSNATNATLSIASAQRSNGGNYYVVASNGSGSVTSSVVTLTYNNTPPVAGPDFTMGAVVGIPSTVLIVGGEYSPTDADNDPLTIISVTGATHGTVTTDGTSATYTAASGPSDAFTYTVSDGYGGTASATVTVFISTNVQGYNRLSVVTPGNGTNVLTFSAIPTDSYALEETTNLLPPILWLPLTTNAAANDGSLIYTNVGTGQQGFYRTRLVP